MTKINKKCFVYCRTGHNSRLSELGSQLEACKNTANILGYKVVKKFLDVGESANNLKRPEYQKMIKKMGEYQIDAIITYSIDRISRNVSDFNKFKKQLKNKGIKLLSVREGDTDGLIGNIFSAVAEWEYEMSSERIKKGLLAKKLKEIQNGRK